MPRLPRYFQESTTFHVITRGMNGEYIFDKNYLKDRIIDLYSDNDDQLAIYGYCIMDNHTHYILGADSIEILSQEMHRINTTYAVYYNKKFDRTGHVFQNRFKSVEIKNYSQLFENLRYIHNNPIVAGMVKNLEDYPHSSYHDFFIKEGSIICPEFLSIIRDNFGDQAGFLDFHKEPLAKLCLDVPSDRENYKQYFLNYVIEFDEKDKVKHLNNAGFSQREISSSLGLSRGKVRRLLASPKGTG